MRRCLPRKRRDETEYCREYYHRQQAGDKGPPVCGNSGERVDGHDFIPSVFEKGALAVLSEKELENPAGPYIQVASSLEAVKGIAEYYRRQLDIKVVGITGSVGKTSTKEVIASVLAQKYNVLKTLGNFNNELGCRLPFSVCEMNIRSQSLRWASAILERCIVLPK